MYKAWRYCSVNSRGLQVVFLNGCSTEPQVRALINAGVTAVIGTSTAIDDEAATLYARSSIGI
jgi:hypothetical protein